MRDNDQNNPTAGEASPAFGCSAMSLANKFHHAYERFAPEFGYETRPDTRIFDPSSPNGKLMVKVCSEIMRHNDSLMQPVPGWVASEIKSTWRAARDSGNQLDSFRIIERMVDRLGYGRMENNPSLVPNAKGDSRSPAKNL